MENIVKLVPKHKRDINSSQTFLVARLEDYLERAKAREFSQFAIILSPAEGGTSSSFAHVDDLMSMIGAIQYLNFRLNQEWDSQ